MKSWVGELRARSCDVHFAGMKRPVMDRLCRGSLVGQLGGERFHHEVAQAVAAVAEAD